jgi:hypothetical protein
MLWGGRSASNPNLALGGSVLVHTSGAPPLLNRLPLGTNGRYCGGCMGLEEGVVEVREFVDTSWVAREKVRGLIRGKYHDTAGTVVVHVLCSRCLVVEAKHCSTCGPVSIDTGHVSSVVDCQVGGAGEGVVGEYAWSR